MGSRRFTSEFPSGHDRYMALQQVSSRILNRAGTLNTMEERELDRRTRQLEFNENLRLAHYETVKRRLCDNLKDHMLYRRALRNSLKTSKSENDLRSSRCDTPRKLWTAESDSVHDARPFGRYSGRTHTRLADAILDLEDKMHHKEREKTRKLLDNAKKESDILIDRKLTTDQILGASHLPLSERLTITGADKLRSVIGRSQAVLVLNKLRTRIAERKEKEKGLKVYKESRGLFRTQNAETDLPVETDLLTK